MCGGSLGLPGEGACAALADWSSLLLRGWLCLCSTGGVFALYGAGLRGSGWCKCSSVLCFCAACLRAFCTNWHHTALRGTALQLNNALGCICNCTQRNTCAELDRSYVQICARMATGRFSHGMGFALLACTSLPPPPAADRAADVCTCKRSAGTGGRCCRSLTDDVGPCCNSHTVSRGF